MTSVELHPDIAARLQERAALENRSISDVVDALLTGSLPTNLEKIEIPDDMRPMLYRRARRYWTQTNNVERLALSDNDLDEQFWLFDNDGIPRLKSEQGKIVILPSPLLAMAEAAERLDFHSGRSDISENADEILRQMALKTHE